MTLSMKSIALATALAAVPAMSGAATVLSADTPYTFAFTLSPGAMVTYDFVVGEAFDIASFAITGSGEAEDIAEITFDYNGVTGDMFDTIIGTGTAAALSIIPGFGPFAAGDTFSFVFNDGIDDNVSLTLSFSTVAEAVGVIPLPAGGMLLLTGLGALLVWRRRSA